jgi:hypothetical protein
MIEKLRVRQGLRSSFVLVLSVFATPAVASAADAEVGVDASTETGVKAEEKVEPTEPPSGVEASGAAKEPAAPAPAVPPPGVEPPAAPAGDLEDATPAKSKWEFGVKGYFRAPVALGFSSRPNPDNLTGAPQSQISYGPNRTVDANYYSFAYTRLQEQDWVELYVTAKSKHADATVGWMGYWLSSAGFRNYDAAWLPGIAYVTLHTDVDVGGTKPTIALSGGAWWPNFGRHEKYDTFTLGQYRQVGEQLKLTVPVSADLSAEVTQGFGTGRDGSFNLLAPPPYQSKVGVSLLHYVDVRVKYKKMVEVGVHHNYQWTRDPNLLQQTSAGKSYTNALKAGMQTIGAEVKVSVPRAGKLWISPSLVQVKNGWALGEAGVEVVHSLSPEGVATNYFGWSGSVQNSTGSGKLVNLGFIYENTLANVLGVAPDTVPRIKASAFGLMVGSHADLPAGSVISRKDVTSFKWGADAEYNPWPWMGVMARFDEVNYDTSNGGYVFSAITGRLSFYSHFASGERIYLQYSRYRYGDRMTLNGKWPWGLPLVAGSDIIQGGPYEGSKPDMDVIKFQADVSF